MLDLYCGTGTIGIFLANYCKRVLGIEINESCIKDAWDNSELNKINNIKFICDNSSVISKTDYKADVVVVDPPRNGLDKVTIDTLRKNKLKRIVYVSCDPMTLVRDIGLLNDVYELKEIKSLCDENPILNKEMLFLGEEIQKESAGQRNPWP